MTRRLGVGVLLGLFALAAGATPARAAKPTATAKAHARALYDRAQRYFDVSQFDKARALYEEAFKAFPLPGFLFNIGQCHRRLGQHHNALTFFRAYLDKKPKAKNRATVEELIRRSEAQLAKQRAAGNTANSGAGTRPVTPDEPRGPASEDRPSGVDATPKRRWSKGLVIGGIAVSLALISTGVITGLMATDRADRFNDPTTPQDQLRGLEDAGRALGATSIVTIAAGSTAAVATLIYYLAKRGGGERKRATGGDKHAATPKTTGQLTASGFPLPGGGGGLLLRGSF